MLNENTYAIAFRMVPLWSQSRPLAGNHGYTAAVRRPHAMKPLLALLLLFIALAGIRYVRRVAYEVCFAA